ncbi:MAG: hypothetical protein KatS3mg008_1294 [Acidimicrobiales bacterium]|nr:MAG: hypothetical protein KatS3mg008_1294 [Acidimicrobiales bacterium]
MAALEDLVYLDFSGLDSVHLDRSVGRGTFPRRPRILRQGERVHRLGGQQRLETLCGSLHPATHLEKIGKRLILRDPRALGLAPI